MFILGPLAPYVPCAFFVADRFLHDDTFGQCRIESFLRAHLNAIMIALGINAHTHRTGIGTRFGWGPMAAGLDMNGAPGLHT